MWAPRNNGYVLSVLAAIPLVCLGWTAYKSIPVIKSATDIPVPTNIQTTVIDTRFEYLRWGQLSPSGRLAQTDSDLDLAPSELDCDVCSDKEGCYCFVIPEPFFRNIGFDYIPQDAQQIYVSTSDLDWNRIQADYSRLLRRRGFAPRELPVDFAEYNNIALWERSRYNGLEGELVAVVWVDQVSAPYLLVILGVDY